MYEIKIYSTKNNIDNAKICLCFTMIYAIMYLLKCKPKGHKKRWQRKVRPLK